jgi:hypothetical protein
MPPDVTTWDKLTSIFTGIGGIGAAIGGIAAWRAASASGAAAKEAREAIALTVRPHLFVNVYQESHRTVSASGEVSEWSNPEPFGPVMAYTAPDTGTALLPPPGTWRAADVLLQFTLASGRQGSKSMPLLEPMGAGPPDDRPLFDPSRLTTEPKPPPDPTSFWSYRSPSPPRTGRHRRATHWTSRCSSATYTASLPTTYRWLPSCGELPSRESSRSNTPVGRLPNASARNP